MADYSYYYRALAGLNPEVSLNDVQPGFYRIEATRNGRKVWEPIAIFPEPVERQTSGDLPEEEELAAVKGFPPQPWLWLDALNAWPWYCLNVVTEADCRAAFETGEWPDQAVGLGHNLPPDLSQDPIARAEHVMAAAGPFRNGPITDKASANAAAHVIKELQQVAGDLKTARDESCAAFERFVKQRSEPFMRTRKQVEALAQEIKPKVGMFMASMGVARVGLKGHAISRKTRAKVVVTEPLVILTRHRDHPEVLALAEKLAREEVRSGQPHPGAHVQEEISYV